MGNSKLIQTCENAEKEILRINIVQGDIKNRLDKLIATTNERLIKHEIYQAR